MPLEPIFLMDLDVHAADGSLTDRLVAAGALSQSKVNGLPGALSDLGSDIAAEESRALAAEGVLAGDIAAEETRALAAEGVLSGDIAAETAARIAAVALVQSNLDAAELALQGDISDEVTRALAAEAALDGRLDILEGPNTQVGSVAYAVKAEETRALAAEAVIAGNLSAEIARAQAEELDIRGDFAAADAAKLAEAKGYTDTKIADLVNSAPAMLDTLGEIATALQAEQSATASILTAISNEVTRATAAETALDGRLDVIEAKAWRQAVLTQNTNGVNSLAKPVGAPAIPNVAAEVMVFIDGRKVFFGSQFTVAVGGGSISFQNLKANQTVELLYWA